MPSPKSVMILNQLHNRKITDSRIIEAFRNVDRKEFIPLTFTRSDYLELEIPVKENYVMLRCFVLAIILQEILKHYESDANLLIVGDASGYTGALFSKIFPNCILGTVKNNHTEYLRSKVDLKVVNLRDIKERFDVVYLDSGVYRLQTVNKIKSTVFKSEGHLISLSRPVTATPSIKPFDYFLTTLKFNDVSILELNLLLASSFLY